VYPQHGTTGTALIQRADVAMYVAKRNRIGQSVYDPREDQHSVGRLALMSDLYDALDSDALELYYQPKINISSGTVVGVEALLRWHHPRFGAITPDEIIPLAEQTGLIKPLTLWVLTHAIRDCSQWLQSGIDVAVAVNLSVYNLQDTGFVSQVQDRLNNYDLPARHLSLEITESAMMANPTHAVEILTLLDGMGVRLAVDDFGTGFSSLAYLKQLPVDELKIDKSFVLQMTEDENDAVIVRSTIDLAHNLGLRVVAEGVESQDVWDLLEILGCDEAQGHFMSRPLAAAQIEQWLRERNAAQRHQPIMGR
jgi:diguanylate cyclase